MFHCYVGVEKLLDSGILDDTSHLAVYSDTEPGCRFETYDLIVTDIPVTAVAINVYNVLGQRVLQRSIRVQTTERVPFESASGLYFVELRDASKNVLAVVKAVKR
ncbi:MAG TPA: T9SS type A sorting domain-containing protein [Chitinophagales bacterium]|nr:T9SS type A sorting domain-containing protein [Chitinophagales bacterium]